MAFRCGVPRFATLLLAGLAALLGGCPKTSPGDSDLPPLLVDADFFETYQARLELSDADAPAADAGFARELVRWLAREDPKAWAVLESRVPPAPEVLTEPLRTPLRAPCQAEAAELHARAAAGDGAEATELYRRCALCDPTNGDYVTHLATAAAQARDWQLAERHARLALAVDPTFLNAYNRLAHVLKNLGRYEEAVSVVERGIRLDGDLQTKAMMLARKGQALWLLSREDEAIKAFKTSRRIGGPPWVQSYLDGEQVLGQRWREPPEP